MLCNLATQFPPFVADFLDRGRSLRRRFREETVTDLLMGSLIIAGGRRLIVEFPDEPVTGADMEWNFVNPNDGTFFRIMLQAKQAYGTGTKWSRHTYRELLHTSGKSGKLQAETLCDTARIPGSATYPLYILYHSTQTCALAHKVGMAHVAGVNLADGYLIERLVKAANTRTLRTSNKSLRVIAPNLFRLSDLFCPPTLLRMGPFALSPGMFSIPVYMVAAGGRRDLGFPVPPTPDEVRNRLVEARRTKGTAKVTKQIDGLPEVPVVASSIPDDVQAILRRSREGGRDKSLEPLHRWRITFVSASPRDDEG